MPGVTPRYSVDGALTYTVSAHVVGGDVVAVGTGGTVAPAADGSVTVVGVATKNARPSYTASGTTGEGDFILDASGPGSEVAVERGYFKVRYGANATVGAKLKAKAVTAASDGRTGGVVPWVSASDTADMIIGECAEPGGVTSGADGLARIY